VLPPCLQAKLADNEAKHTKFTERLAHESSKRGEYDKELKQVEEEYSKAEKALEAASRKAEAAAAAMKELEQRDVKVCACVMIIAAVCGCEGARPWRV
jgi:chromosome segregation ATPase